VFVMTPEAAKARQLRSESDEQAAARYLLQMCEL